MSTRGARLQPAKQSARAPGDYEAVDFVRRRNKRRRARDLAKQARRKNRH